MRVPTGTARTAAETNGRAMVAVSAAAVTPAPSAMSITSRMGTSSPRIRSPRPPSTGADPCGAVAMPSPPADEGASAHPAQVRCSGRRGPRLDVTDRLFCERCCDVVLGRCVVHLHQLRLRGVPDGDVLDHRGHLPGPDRLGPGEGSLGRGTDLLPAGDRAGLSLHAR